MKKFGITQVNKVNFLLIKALSLVMFFLRVNI